MSDPNLTGEVEAGLEPRTAESEITKVEIHPSVSLVVNSNDGEVLFLYSCESRLLAAHLSLVSAMDDQHPVVKLTVNAIGVDRFEVTRDYVMALRAMFFNLSWTEIEAFATDLPESAKYFFVVSR